ncbi:glycosyltransferase [Gammaproteobacteria bacterium]|nr:glycosyltransferase [Gammaproteobacteria bacterium]
MKKKIRSSSLLLITPPSISSSHSMRIYGDQVANAARKHFKVDIYNWQNVECYLNPFSSRWYKYIHSPKRLERDYKPSIQHITDQAYAHLYNKNAKKNILTVHDINPIIWFRDKLGNNLARPPVFFYYVARYFKKFDHIITPTYTTKNHLIDFLSLSSDRITVVNNCVDMEQTKLPQKKLNGINILVVGDSFYKNIKTIFSAISYFVESQSITLKVHWVVTSDPDKKITQILSKRPGAVELKLYRNLTRPNLLDLYASCDLLLFPSLIEGFGYPIIEAYRKKLPVITSNYGAMAEIADGRCFLVNPLSVSEIASAIENVIRCDSNYKALMLDNAYNYSLKFSGENFQKSLLNVYEV